MTFVNLVCAALVWADAHPLFTATAFGIVFTATAKACEKTSPRASAWLSAAAAMLPLNYTKMSPGAAPRKPVELPADEVPTVPDRKPDGPR